MKWIKINSVNDLPKVKGWYATELKSGSKSFLVYFNVGGNESKEWLDLVDSWLDESEPSFTLENMQNCWDASSSYMQQVLTGQDITEFNREQYFKQTYNIDI